MQKKGRATRGEVLLWDPAMSWSKIVVPIFSRAGWH